MAHLLLHHSKKLAQCKINRAILFQCFNRKPKIVTCDYNFARLLMTIDSNTNNINQRYKLGCLNVLSPKLNNLGFRLKTEWGIYIITFNNNVELVNKKFIKQ